MINEDRVCLWMVRKKYGGSCSFGASGELEAFPVIVGLEEFGASARAAVGGDVQRGVGPCVFHVRAGELGPGGEDVGGVGFDVDGLLNFTGLGELCRGLSKVGVVGDFAIAYPVFQTFLEILVTEKIGRELWVDDGFFALPDAAVVDDEFGFLFKL